MPVPNLTSHGVLPEGIHDCSRGELKGMFGKFQSSDRRPQLFQRLEQFLRAMATASIHGFLIVDGSFVTDEPQPNDIDLILVQLQAEIDAYLGLKNPEPAEAFRESPPPYADGNSPK